MKQRLLLLMLTLVGMPSIKAQTDVTSTYLTNAGFDTDDSGWTAVGTGTTYHAVVAYGANYAPNANFSADNAPVNKFGRNEGKAALLSAGWGDQAIYTQDVTLPAGQYKITFDVYNANTSATKLNTNRFGWVPNTGTAVYNSATDLASRVWYTLSVSFTLGSETAGKISLGLVSKTGEGSGTIAKCFVDNVKIFRMDTGKPTVAHPVDYSDMINQTTWSYDEDDGSGSASALTDNVNKGEWTGRCAERYRGRVGHYGKKLYQSVSLSAGVYQVKAACMSAAANGVEGENALPEGTLNNAYFYANGEETTYPLANATSKYMSQIVTLSTAGTIEFGVKTVAVGANWSAIGSATIVKLANSLADYNNDPKLSEGETYYLYNDEGAGYLREGNTWGTKASLKPYGGLVLNVKEDGGTYKLYTPIYGGNKGLGYDLFVDNDSPCEWDINKISDGVYTLYNATVGGYLASNGLGNALTTVAAVTDAAKWNIVTKNERTETLAAATEDNPMDATYFITNPDFSRNMGTTGWTVTSGGGAAGTNGDAENYNWQQWNSTFNIRQNLTGLPAGTYQLETQGFYRPGGNNTESTDQNAELYAGTMFTVPVQLVSSEGKNAQDNTNGFTTANTNSGSTKYVPNSQADATKAFNADVYDSNTLTFVVGNDGAITIGGRKTIAVGSDWTVLDNFRLFYLGSDVTDAALAAIPIPVGQMNQDVKGALLDAQEALSEDPTIANYEALVTAIDNAKKSIAVYAKIKKYFDGLSTTQLGGISLATFQAADVYKHYSDGIVNEVADATTGTYVSLNDVVNEWRTFASNYWKSQTLSGGEDLTAFVVNQGFEMDDAGGIKVPAGWTVPFGANDNKTMAVGAASSSEGSWLYNMWDNSTNQKRLEQSMTGLPKGHYEITAYIQGYDGRTTDLLGIGGASTETASQTTTGNNNAHTVTVNAYVTDDAGTLTIRVQNAGSDEVRTFFKADNFRLKYISSTFDGITLTNPTGQMKDTVKKTMTDAKAAYDASATLANLNALLEAYNNANASIAEYEKINRYLTKLNTAVQRGGIPQATIEADAVWQNYRNGQPGGTPDNTTGTYTSATEVETLWHEMVKTYWATNKAANKDMTAFIFNQGFEMGPVGVSPNADWASFPGWANAWHYAENDNRPLEGASVPEGTYAINLWSTDMGRYATLEVSQTLTDVPYGQYELTAWLTSHDGYTLKMQGGSESTEVTIAEDRVFEKVTLACLVDDDGVLRISASHSGTAEGTNTSFLQADHFQLKYIGETLTLALPTKETRKMRGVVRTAEDDAYETYSLSKTVANYRAGIVAYKNAVYSADCYDKAKLTIDKVDLLLTKTNVYTYDAYKTFYEPYSDYKNQYTDNVLADELARTLEWVIFGNRTHHQTGLMIVPFLSSAWDCAEVYKWPAGDYWVNTWSKEGDTDGSDYVVPFLEYWTGSGTLAAKTLTATALGTNGSTYTVKARVRLSASATPTHIYMQVGNDPATRVAITGTQIGSSNRYLTDEVQATGTADSEGLKIKFIVEEGTNVSWLCFKDVWVDYSGEVLNLSDLATEISKAEAHKLGFWKYAKGHEGDDEHEPDEAYREYSPYNNVDGLKALSAAQALQRLGSSAPPALVNAAIKDLKDATWTPNEETEMNAFFWTDNYNASQIEDIWVYDEEGNLPKKPFRGLMPSGWDLDGRVDSYNTRIQQRGLNTNDTGLRAVDDETGLFIKYNTNYGKETGYTLPLEPDTKYSFSFIYSCWGENKEIRTKIRIYNKTRDTYMTVGQEGGFFGYTANDFVEMGSVEGGIVSTVAPINNAEGVTPYFQVNKGEHKNIGDSLSKNWDVFRSYFKTPVQKVAGVNDEYVIFFEKDRDYARDVLHRQGYLTEQYQVMLGDIYLVRYNNPTNVTFLNGESRDNTTPYSFDNSALHGQNIELNRSLTAGRWATLCLPFKLVWREMKQLYGIEKTYYYTGTTFSGHYAVLNFTGIDNGLRANTPVLVKVPEDAGDKTTTDKPVESIEEDSHYGTHGGLIFRNYVCKSGTPIAYDTASEKLFNFVGTYEVINMPLWSVFVRYNSTENKDEMVQKQDAAKRNWLQATRAYFKIDPSADGASVKLMSFTVDDIETGIMAIEPDGQMTVTSGNIYDLNGRMVRANAKTLEGLKPGIYVVDGRKVMIK